MVFYLKYRPKKISELDNEELREKLDNLLKGNLPDKIPHAFLFTGPKGLGKTSTARILAKSINCTNREKSEIEPCNKCSSCTSINNGSSLDVLEIDAASNRGIDEIRDLREKIKLSPFNSKKKIYIIDEVHMLTTEAFNALLKTLEEPPAHAVFVLCTTEPQKVPGTITSRCFHIVFYKATDEDLINSFERIAKGEGIKTDKESLLQIAKLSDGSFRDGAKIIEELSTNSSQIDLNLIEEKYKTRTIGDQIEKLMAAFYDKNAMQGTKVISVLSKEGADFKLISEELINNFHAKLLLQISENHSNHDIEETKDIIKLLVDSYMSIKYAVLPQLPLELAMVEWCSMDNSEFRVQNEGLASQGETLQGKSSSSPKRKAASASGYGEPKHDKILEELINNLKKDNFTVAGILRGCKVVELNGGKLVLSTNFKFHKERLGDRKVIDLIEEKLFEITGNKTKVVIL